ncbi:MAG: hypothetical protein R3Y06_10535 [Faecalibacterium sp.]
MKLIQKAAYLKGLMEGLGIDESTKEGKVLLAMHELLEEMAAVITDMDDDVDQLYDDIDTVAEELEALEDDLYEEDDEDEEDEDEEGDYEYEITCTECGAVNLANEDVMFSGEVLYCASCNKPLDFFEETEEGEEAPEA